MLIQRVVWATLLLAATGCGVSAAKLQEGKSFVQEGLEVWKKGGKPADLMARDRPVQFHEAMWNAGQTLLSFETGKVSYNDRDRVIRCEARLTVRDRKGKEKTENVVYDVKLESPVKVMNNPMP